MSTMIGDPRISLIRKRLKSVKVIVPVLSPKGGVGKTLISTMLSLVLAKNNMRVGLLDLDITNPTSHIVLGVEASLEKVSEDRGVLPINVNGVLFMSPAIYSLDKPLALRGYEITDAIRELLAVTRWEKLDVLIADTPPGISDEILELLLLVRDPSVIIVSTPSILALKSVERIIEVLRKTGIQVLGTIENMSDPREILDRRRIYESIGCRLLAITPLEPGLEEKLGDPNKLLDTSIAKILGENITPVIKNLIA